jgi:predicted HTH transcriptional regulator
MINKSFDLIDKSDIDALIVNEAAENRALEYKENLPGGTNDDKKEFLADVSAFANAAGGDILFGISEKRDANGKTTGIPEAANGLSGINVDEVTRRLDSMILDGIAPRINGVRIKAVEGFSDGPVILLRVPKSCINVATYPLLPILVNDGFCIQQPNVGYCASSERKDV